MRFRLLSPIHSHRQKRNPPVLTNNRPIRCHFLGKIQSRFLWWLFSGTDKSVFWTAWMFPRTRSYSCSHYSWCRRYYSSRIRATRARTKTPSGRSNHWKPNVCAKKEEERRKKRKFECSTLRSCFRVRIVSLSPRTCLSLSLEPAQLMRTRSFVLGWVEFLTRIFFYSAIHNN